MAERNLDWKAAYESLKRTTDRTIKDQKGEIERLRTSLRTLETIERQLRDALAQVWDPLAQRKKRTDTPGPDGRDANPNSVVRTSRTIFLREIQSPEERLV